VRRYFENLEEAVIILLNQNGIVFLKNGHTN
jgi:filamentous hemagglutinin family protein